MVKLATVRDCRLYGPWSERNRWEYINAGVYMFGTIVLLVGFLCELSESAAKPGLVVLLISLVIVSLVNVHDLFAHFAGIDFRLPLMRFDWQLGLVEFGVPFVQILGSVVFFVGVLFIFIVVEKGHGHFKLQRHGLNMLIGGPALWLLGSIHNACQIYEKADGHLQILQQCVHVPFLLGSCLFLVAGIINRYEHIGFKLLGKKWVVMGIVGSILFFIGGLMNLMKVFKMQQMDGIRLEKLRCGAQERLSLEREGQVPLILEEQRRRKRQHQLEEPPRLVPPPHVPTPYKDVLVGQSHS
ncbi:hypothetical protein Sjap_021090 [Stephania japonica]|uniref:Uncharacterized protein n=1 Tax=Stephania japonica TaxID=461633 RepID=A0AAP0F1Y7_9MAGN